MSTIYIGKTNPAKIALSGSKPLENDCVSKERVKDSGPDTVPHMGDCSLLFDFSDASSSPSTSYTACTSLAAC